TVGDRANHAGHLTGWARHVVDEQIGRIYQPQPRTCGGGHSGAMCYLPFFAHCTAYTLKLLSCLVTQRDDVVQRVGYLTGLARPVARQPSGEVSLLERYQSLQKQFSV